MTNPRAKGSRTERRAKKELELCGWNVYRVPGAIRFNKGVDLFGLWDLLALKDKQRKWIQCKTNKWVNLRPFQAFKREYGNEYDSFEIWTWYEPGKSKTWKGWRKQTL